MSHNKLTKSPNIGRWTPNTNELASINKMLGNSRAARNRRRKEKRDQSIKAAKATKKPKYFVPKDLARPVIHTDYSRRNKTTVYGYVNVCSGASAVKVTSKGSCGEHLAVLFALRHMTEGTILCDDLPLIDRIYNRDEIPRTHFERILIQTIRDLLDSRNVKIVYVKRGANKAHSIVRRALDNELKKRLLDKIDFENEKALRYNTPSNKTGD